MREYSSNLTRFNSIKGTIKTLQTLTQRFRRGGFNSMKGTIKTLSL